MKRMLKLLFPALAIPALSLAGGLYLQVGNAAANPEAKRLGAVLVAHVSACHEPAKSTVTANLLSVEENQVRRRALQVRKLEPSSAFAVLGTAAGQPAAIELTVTNPEFGTYQRHVLVRVDPSGIAWKTVRDLNNQAPTAADVRALQEPGARAATRP